MPLQIGLDATTVKIGSKLATEHVQDPSALWIRKITKHLMRVIKVSAHDRIRVIGDASDLTGAAVKLIEHVIAAVFVFVIESLVICREAFVEPDLTPILAGDKVAKPLMGHFVSNEALAVADVFGGIRKEGAVSQCGATGILH